MASCQQRILKVLFLPPIPWLPYRQSFTPGTGPDPFELSKHLLELGITTEIVDPGHRLWRPFARHSTLLASLDPLRGLRVLLAKRKFDLIVSVFEGAAVSLLLLQHMMFLRTPIALWDIALTEDWALRERILDYVVPRVHSLLVLASHQKHYISGRWETRARVEVIGHQVDTTFFSPIPHHMNNDGPIVSVGDDAGRDFDTLLEALSDLPVDTLIKSRRDLQLDKDRHPRVRVISEWISHVALRALYAQSRIVVVPLTETLNAGGVSTILEASAMGKALIVSDSPVIRDFVVPGETCLMIPPRNAPALREAITLLLGDPAHASRLGQNARRFVEARFSIPVFAQNFGKALRQICTADPAPNCGQGSAQLLRSQR